MVIICAINSTVEYLASNQSTSEHHRDGAPKSIKARYQIGKWHCLQNSCLVSSILPLASNTILT